MFLHQWMDDKLWSIRPMKYYIPVKEEQTIDIYEKLDESQRHYAEWKKWISKGNLLRDMLMCFTWHSWKDKNYRDREQMRSF